MEKETPPELLRDLNDRTFRVLWGLGAEEGDFVCECGRKGCDERLELLVIEYAARESQPLLAPGHVLSHDSVARPGRAAARTVP
jgi:hypothetical protein